MNGNGPMEVHYINAGFPYSASDSFMEFFEGLSHPPVTYSQSIPSPDQENPYWLMNMNAYKFGYSGSGSTSYYCPYGMHDSATRMDAGRRTWEYPSMINMDDTASISMQSDENMATTVSTSQEESIPSQPSTSNSEVVWQDDIDPDNMTYEELLDLGETVGNESKGLPEELISLLPTSKCNLGSFFSRRKSGERCVICQMKYKIGDRQTKLPCKHVYHSECITKWLGINKICPICNNEVFIKE